MSSWDQVRTAIQAAVTSALPTAVQAATPVDWNGGGKHVAAQRILLDVVSSLELHTRDPNVDSVDVSSLRDVTVQLKAESQHDTATVDGLWLLTLAVMGLRRLPVESALNAAGVSLVDVPLNPVRVGERDQNGRKLSIFVADLTFRCVIDLTTGDTPLDLIEHVEVSGEAETPDTLDTVQIPEFTVDDPDPSP